MTKIFSSLASSLTPRLRHVRHVSRLRRFLPKSSFIFAHYSYFIISGLVGGLILWGSSTPEKSVPFIDALFIAVSAMTEAGLNTVNLSQLNTFQQFTLFVLIMMGSAIFVSAFIVIVRLKAFDREMKNVMRSAQHSRMPSLKTSPIFAPQDDAIMPMRTIRFPSLDGVEMSPRAKRMEKPAPKPMPEGTTSKTDTPFSHRTSESSEESDIDLTFEERERLGGTEYKAVLFLSYLVPLYFILWQLISCISCGWWIAAHRAALTRANGINPWWTGAFNAVSAFNNNGMSLLDANMVAFQDCVFLLITMGLLILAGNTAYPIFLRIIVWNIWRWLPDTMADHKATLRFLLDHPRRCYTNLFPSRHTWWLAGVIIVLNGVDWAAFEILNIGNKKITDLHGGIEVLDGLFQALAVRSGGFYVVTIPNMRISLQVLYVLMMYVSVYPVAISMRNSNIYEERSLGIFAQPDDLEDAVSAMGSDQLSRKGSIATFSRRPNQNTSRAFFVRQQVRAQLADDAYWIVLAVFIIMIIEESQFDRDPVNFSVFNVIFEVVSGYGTVGISVGVPNNNYSFCGSWHTLSKLVLIAVMIKGRHRGLPVAIDHAVQLPARQSQVDNSSLHRRSTTFTIPIQHREATLPVQHETSGSPAIRRTMVLG